MANYGRQTIGASWVQFESRKLSRRFTLTGTETLQKVTAHIRTQGSASNGTRCLIVRDVDYATLFLSDVLGGFTDTVGAWKDYVFSANPSLVAGNYWSIITCDAIAGGGNTIQIAYDLAGSDSNAYRVWFNEPLIPWPDMPTNFTGYDDFDSGYQQDISMYAVTSSGGGTVPRGRGTNGNFVDMDGGF